MQSTWPECRIRDEPPLPAGHFFTGAFATVLELSELLVSVQVPAATTDER